MTTLELIEKLQCNEDWRTIDGIAYKQPGVDIAYTKPRELIENLDTLDFPYRIIPATTTEVIVNTSRGCYGSCNYCAIIAFYNTCTGGRVRRRSPENVIQEILSLLDVHPVATVRFHDDNFEISSSNAKKWFDEFYDLVKKHNIKISLKCAMRVNEVVRAGGLLKKYVDIGLCYISLGAESFTQSQLDYYSKKTTVEQNFEAVQILSQLNIDYGINIILFDPRVTIREMIENTNNLKKLANYFSEHFIMYVKNNILIATEGTDSRSYVMENGLYANNEGYYKFLHEDTSILFDARNEWFKSIKIFNDDSVIVYARRHCDHIVVDKVIDFFRRVYLMDLESTLETCELIKKGVRSPELDEITYKKYQHEIKQMGEEFRQLKEHINQAMEMASDL